jgi:PAS domain S-box-containing protein
MFAIHTVGKPLVVFVAPADRPSFRTQLAQIGTSAFKDMSLLRKHLHEEQAQEIYIQPRDGTAFPAAVSISVKYIPESKKIASIHWLIRDVSERVQAEEVLKRANEQLESRVSLGERLTLALDAANLGTWDWNIQTNQVIWSGHHSSLFGLPSGTFGNSFASFMDCAHPEDRPQILEAIELSKRNKSPYSADFRVIWPDGSLHHISGKGKCYYDAQGEAVRMLGVVMDTSNRKRVEETLRKFSKELEVRVQERTQQLKESEERFRSAFDNAVAGIALVGLGGRWLKVNPALCQLLGYSEEELLRLDYQAITHPDDLEQSLNAVDQLLTSEILSAQIEKRFLHKQGHPVWVICSLSLVRDEQGQPLYFVKQFQDISERRAMEQMKSEFISVVSHELRTPLASIRGSLGLLAAGVLHDEPATTQQMLDIAAHETERLVRLVNDILDLERFEASKFTWDTQWCDAATLLQQVAEVIKPLAEESKITVSLLLDTQSVPVWAAPDRLVQVLINLLSNAIKFSPRESTVTLTVQNQVNQVLFQVQDQGRGVPADKVETIFGQFQQVDASDARDKGGTGLGLAICRTIVQKHGGQIWVESALGKGSTFYFTLPIPLE